MPRNIICAEQNCNRWITTNRLEQGFIYCSKCQRKVDARNKDKDGDVECPDCGKGMKFLKRKGDGFGDTHKTYSVWGCKECHRKHTIYDDGDAKEVDWDGVSTYPKYSAILCELMVEEKKWVKFVKAIEKSKKLQKDFNLDEAKQTLAEHEEIIRMVRVLYEKFSKTETQKIEGGEK